jgi:Fe-S-cluster containining protein
MDSVTDANHRPEKPERPARPWWDGGLRFECTQCGLCCRGSGDVSVTDDDIGRLAKRLGMTDVAFRERHTRTGRRGQVTLRDAKNDDCTFFREGTGCTVYADRPVQCRTYPFWSSVLHDAETWRVEAGHCEGIGRGDLIVSDEIEALLARRRRTF